MIYASKDISSRTVIIFTALFMLVTGCSTNESADDPLKHSKKLITEGHSSLYNNGAFQVPHTEIRLIPAGESAQELAFELMGMRARQSFLTSLKNAADSVYIVPAGSKLSLDYAKKIQSGGELVGGEITATSRPAGKLIVYRSVDFGKDTTFKAWQFGKKSARAMLRYGIAVEDESYEAGDSIADAMTEAGMKGIDKSWRLAGSISKKSTAGAKKSLLYAGDKFVKGYAGVPEKLSDRGKEIAEAANPDNFTEQFSHANELRSEYSSLMTDIIVASSSHYADDVGESFSKAGDSYRDSVGVTGFSLAIIKSARWVLQGVLWDGLVKPVSKIGAASVGYVTVNLAVFPTMVIAGEGVATTNLAVEVVWNSAGAAYDLIAPSATAALASVYSMFQYTGGNLMAGATTAGGAVLGGASIATGQIAGKTVQGVGYISGKGISYIGVPLTAAGVTLTTGTVGVVAGGAGAVAGSTVLVGGEALSASSRVFGNVLAGATAVTGTTASVVAGTAVGVYEVSKAIVVPAGYELGGGIVLGYGTVSQLGAHSVLAVADASYLVLSLEGPRWVIYAVKGDLGNGDDLPPGTLLDLETMQNEGEEFYYLPVSDGEMKSVVEHVYGELPTVPAKVDDEL